MLVDTHCHINIMLRGFNRKSESINFSDKELEEARQIIKTANENNVKQIVNVGTNLIESLSCIELAKTFKDNYATIGIHPNDIENFKISDDFKIFDNLLKLKKENKIVGIGECGIDKHYHGYNLEDQKDTFKRQIELALKHKLALVIHSRDAAEETFEVLDKYRYEANLKGVMHCFSYDLAYAKECLNLGLFIGIGGTITYPKNDSLREIAQSIELKKIVLETDSPFLPLQEFRGQKNSPAQIADIAKYISELRQVSLNEVATQTTSAAKFLFDI